MEKINAQEFYAQQKVQIELTGTQLGALCVLLDLAESNLMGDPLLKMRAKLVMELVGLDKPANKDSNEIMIRAEDLMHSKFKALLEEFIRQSGADPHGELRRVAQESVHAFLAAVSNHN